MTLENNKENGEQLPVICNSGKIRTFFHENNNINSILIFT